MGGELDSLLGKSIRIFIGGTFSSLNSSKNIMKIEIDF